jgi:PAS domain S-box-containing protein
VPRQRPKRAPHAAANHRQTVTRPAGASRRAEGHSHGLSPELALIYDTAPVGLAFLSPDCRYLQINQRLTEICGIPVADHIGRTVRETVPAVADQVEEIVASVLRSGKPVMGVPITSQRTDERNADRMWITNWYPLKHGDGSIAGINVVAEEVTDRKHTEAILAQSAKALQDSEARFAELADNMSQFAWTADATGWIYWYNKRWHDYTGTTLADVEGWGWQKVHHPDHVERVVRRIRHCFETGTPWEDTFPLRARDGTYRWFLSRALPIRNAAGAVVRWFGTNTDVTERIEAEQALRGLNTTLADRVAVETRERLHWWNVSQDLLVVATESGECLSVNPAWTAALGWSESELVGGLFDALLHPDDHEKTLAQLSRLALGRRTLRFGNRLRDKAGSYHWLSWRAVADGGRIYAMGRDITELKQAEDEVREARDELARVTRQTTLAAMTASIAHEINQPLTAIVMNADAGLRHLTRDPPRLREATAALKRIEEAGDRATNVIGSIRGMMRKDNRARTALSLNDIVREILALMRGEIAVHGVIVEEHLAEPLPQIIGERTPLQQVVLNLVMNAVEAMKDVSDRRRVLDVATRAVDGRDVLLTVADTGPGIKPEDMGRIFEAFFTTKPQGMGMGLSICRSIVEAHQGRLWASAATPHSTIFHMQLPLRGGAGARE